MSDDSVNMPEMIDEARKLHHANKGQFTESGDAKPKLKQLLERKNISLNEFKRSMKINPSMDFQERLTSLSPEKEYKSREGPNTRRNRANKQQGSSEQGSSEQGSSEEDSSEGPVNYSDLPDDMFRFVGDDEKPSFGDRRYMSEKTGRETLRDKMPLQDSDEEDKAFEFYSRLFSHRKNPEMDAMRALRGRHSQDPITGGDDEALGFYNGAPTTGASTEFTQEYAAPGTKLPKPEDDEDPSVGFSASSIGAETPKGDTANPRVLNDPKSTRAGQGEGRTISQFLQTSSDSTNVMDPAWALLKGNPSMRDAEGRAINHPAAMVYENLAAKVGAGEMGHETYNHEDDESVADKMQHMKRSAKKRMPTYRIHSKTRESGRSAIEEAMREKKLDEKRLDEYRQEARDETDHEMRFGEHSNQEGDETPYKNYGIQQSTGTDVRMKPGNIMDQM